MIVKNPKFEISAVSPKQYPSNGLPEVVLVGNITALPGVRTVLDRFERFGDIRFFVPEDSEFSVAYGAVIAS